MLTEKTEEQINVLPDGNIESIKTLIIFRDNIEIARNCKTELIEPDHNITEKSEKLKAIAPVVWTSEVVAAHAAKKNK